MYLARFLYLQKSNGESFVVFNSIKIVVLVCSVNNRDLCGRVQHGLSGARLSVLYRHVHVPRAQTVQRMFRRLQLVVLHEGNL